MDVARIRKLNLLALIERSGRSRKDFAESVGMGYVQLNQILGPSEFRNIGERLARRIEERLKLERGWLDQEHEDSFHWLLREQAVSGVAEERPGLTLVKNEPAEFPLKSGGIELDKLDVRASMGGGIPMPERETVIDSIRVPMEWVHEHFPHITAARNLKIITGFGDSMMPTYKHGDPLIVDVGVQAMDIDNVYVFAYQEELFIKRIQRLPGKAIRVISDNVSVYPPFELTAEQRAEVHVIARVICAVNMNKIG